MERIKQLKEAGFLSEEQFIILCHKIITEKNLVQPNMLMSFGIGEVQYFISDNNAKFRSLKPAFVSPELRTDRSQRYH